MQRTYPNCPISAAIVGLGVGSIEDRLFGAPAQAIQFNVLYLDF
jgi:hypothetical protein